MTQTLGCKTEQQREWERTENVAPRNRTRQAFMPAEVDAGPDAWRRFRFGDTNMPMLYLAVLSE